MTTESREKSESDREEEYVDTKVLQKAVDADTGQGEVEISYFEDLDLSKLTVPS